MSAGQNSHDPKTAQCKASPTTSLPVRQQRDQFFKTKSSTLRTASQQFSAPFLTDLEKSARSQISISKDWLVNGLSRELLPYPLDSIRKESPRLRGCLKRSTGSKLRGSVRFVLPPTVFVVESFGADDENKHGDAIPLCDSSDAREALSDVVLEKCEDPEQQDKEKSSRDKRNIPAAAASSSVALGEAALSSIGNGSFTLEKNGIRVPAEEKLQIKLQ